jgi:hypothetical protein
MDRATTHSMNDVQHNRLNCDDQHNGLNCDTQNQGLNYDTEHNKTKPKVPLC